MPSYNQTKCLNERKVNSTRFCSASHETVDKIGKYGSSHSGKARLLGVLTLPLNSPILFFLMFPRPLPLRLTRTHQSGIFILCTDVYYCPIKIRAQVLAVNFPIGTGGSEVDLWESSKSDREVPRGENKPIRVLFLLHYLSLSLRDWYFR